MTCNLALLAFLSGGGVAYADDSARIPTGNHKTSSKVLTAPAPEEVATQELQTQLQAIWSGANLRRGTTAIYAVDADTGEELYRVHEGVPLNPASNVKLISTGTVLATLGPEWRYETRVLGAEPDAAGLVQGGLYLYGNYDPTLGPGAMTSIAESLFAQGVRSIEGDIMLGDDQRDILAASRVRVTVHGSKPGKAASIEVWPSTAMVQVHSKKVRSKARGRSRVRLQKRVEEVDGQEPVMHLDLRGNIRRGHKRVLWAKVPNRSTFTGSVFKQALVDAGIQVQGTTRLASFDEFNAEASRAGRIPWPLAEHQSKTMASLVARVNKRSLNHLADRLVMSAARSIHGGPLNMGDAVELMKEWLGSIGVDADAVVLDTGSGLSYRTRLTAQQIVKVLRAAGGYATPETQTTRMRTFRDSLAIGGIDGTLRSRFRKQVSLDSRMQGKTGTLRSVIALSGFLTRQDGRTICFSIVTNGHRNHRKRTVRLEHEHLVAKLDTFLGKKDILDATAQATAMQPALAELAPPQTPETMTIRAECPAPAGLTLPKPATNFTPATLVPTAPLRVPPLP
jgi:D-alanyl-D-alanine carboxypeptidase/D-alanyl-D-alanine-endopeptidase (penicillin-binding protein 4)